nr:phospholipase D family protein [Methylotenera sp.]
MKYARLLSLIFALFFTCTGQVLAYDDLSIVDAQIAAHPNQSGIYVLDKGEDALLARAWLADHAQKTIEVQYFIW